MKLYAENIKKDKNWAGDYEIQTTCYYLNININIVYKDIYEYKNYSYYKAPTDTEGTINLLYVSNNHFKLLYKRNTNNDLDNINDNNNIDKFKNIKDFIKNKKLLAFNNNYISKMHKFVLPKHSVNSNKYTDYPRINCKDKYNEIYAYLISKNNIMPERLCYKDKSEFKKIEKKRRKFRKQIKEKYLIKDKRLS